MDYIVYFLGAGFSAPLGLPVMSNFLERSRDQGARDPQFGYFRELFDRLRNLHFTKSYYDTNLSNIEEILSLLEMQAVLERDDGLRATFTRYLSDVVTYHTPPFLPVPNDRLGGEWSASLGLRDPLHAHYARFVASLHLASVERTTTQPLVSERSEEPYRYGVITVNYDTIIETLTTHLNFGSERLRIITDPDVPDAQLHEGLPMAKLHGTVGGMIAPPTWNKSFHRDVLPAWRLAYRLLSHATHIRVIGYSLPDSDAYVRYLFKSAILPQSAERLKSFDVLCRDDGNVRRRYGSFTAPGGAARRAFRAVDVVGYLSGLDVPPRQDPAPDRARVTFNTLEAFHAHHFANAREERW